ncbi:MAG: hypothetical protein GY935_16365 [Gammaproteobacteria bacterium]|nr:hypothetical protein [Gammaproteobacteria bacterium]
MNTNLAFLARLVEMPEFIAADFDTSFIATHHTALFERDDECLARALVLAAAALLPALDKRATPNTSQSTWDLRDHWRMNLLASQVVSLAHKGLRHEILIRRGEHGWHFGCGDFECLLAGKWIDKQSMRVEINSERVEFPVLIDEDAIALVYRGQTFQFEIFNPVHDVEGNVADADHPRAPMSGAVVALPVVVGDTVEPGTTLVVIEAMKMEHAIVAQVNASVSEILVAVGDQVEEGDTLVLLEVE